MCHQPFYHKRGSRRLAFFIHGFMGSPDYFATWSELLFAEGFDCKGILLPGHGGGPKDFARATAQQWIEHVRGEVHAVGEGYEDILLAGHSMGGLLCLLMAAENRRVSGVFAMNPAIKLHFRPHSLVKYVSLTLGRPERDNEKRRVIRSQVGVTLTGLRNAFCYFRPTKELRRLIMTLPSCLEQIACPVFLLRSQKDETVSGRAIARLHAHLPDSEMLTLRRSTHDYYPAPDRAMITEALLQFSRRL